LLRGLTANITAPWPLAALKVQQTNINRAEFARRLRWHRIAAASRIALDHPTGLGVDDGLRKARRATLPGHTAETDAQEFNVIKWLDAIGDLIDRQAQAQKAQAKQAAQKAKISGADRSPAQVFSDLPAGPCGGPMACRIRV
jgi:hypothetical protein